MLKFVGMMLVLGGSTGIGISMAKELDQRIEELRILQQLILALRGEIRYRHLPLSEAFLSLAEHAPAPFDGFFDHVAKELECRKGNTAEEIWKRNLKKHLSVLHLNRQELAALGQLGNMLGYLDVEMQVNMLDYYLEQLKISAAQAVEAAKSRRKLYQYMGVLGGAALVIVIF